MSAFAESLRHGNGPPSGQLDMTLDGKHDFWRDETFGQARWIWDGAAGPPFLAFIVQRDGRFFVFSQDGRHVAYYGRAYEGHFVGRDEVTEPTFHDMTRSVPPTWSQDGSRFAYGAVLAEGLFHLVVDGAIETRWQVAAVPPVFSPDGRRLAWVAQERPFDGASQWVVLDGVPGDAHGSIEPDSLVFSADSQHVVYTARRGDRTFIVLDGVGAPEAETVHSPTFSLDGSRFAYVRVARGRHTVVANGDVVGSADMAFDLSFDPTSTRLVWTAREGKRVRVMSNDVGHEAFDDGWGTPVFSSDGRHLAYLAATRAGRGLLRRSRLTWQLVLDGRAGQAWDEVRGEVRFWPDSERACFAARRGRDWHIVVDDRPSDPFESVGQPEVDASGRLVHMGQRGGLWTVLVDGVGGPWADEIGYFEGVRFRVDGDGNAAWAGRFGHGWHPVVGEQVGPSYQGVGPGTFAGSRCTFIAMRGTDVISVSADVPIRGA